MKDIFYEKREDPSRIALYSTFLNILVAGGKGILENSSRSVL
jgi:hypothetical protein